MIHNRRVMRFACVCYPPSLKPENKSNRLSDRRCTPAPWLKILSCLKTNQSHVHKASAGATGRGFGVGGQINTLHLMKLMLGGKRAHREARLMVTEKIHAGLEANARLMAGASPGTGNSYLSAACFSQCETFV
jgi:hypothetical protein